MAEPKQAGLSRNEPGRASGGPSRSGEEAMLMFLFQY